MDELGVLPPVSMEKMALFDQRNAEGFPYGFGAQRQIAGDAGAIDSAADDQNVK